MSFKSELTKLIRKHLTDNPDAKLGDYMDAATTMRRPRTRSRLRLTLGSCRTRLSHGGRRDCRSQGSRVLRKVREVVGPASVLAPDLADQAR
jgi:hypothetical protein